MEIGKSLIVLTTILTASVQIFVPDEAANQKPQYSQGIQTWNYRRPNQIQVDHSYSKVYSHNNRSISTDSENADDDSRRLYPVYNAHTYGARPHAGQSHNARPFPGQSQVYVINGTRIGRRSNAIRQVVAYNKEKRSPKIQIYKTCPTHATGQFVYETSCNQFLNCWKGRGYVQNCAPGTLFNPETLECDFPEKVTCVSGPRENVLTHERKANLQQIGCPQDFSGLIPNYTDCSKFINCVSGIENFMDCPTGTLFDMNKNICDFAHKATCFNGQNENLKKDVDNKLDFGTTRRSDQLRYKYGEIRCPEGVQDLVMHPLDCSKFLNCANGQTFIQDCAPGTLFNPVLKICDFPYNVRCEVGTNSGFQNGNRNHGGTHDSSNTSQNHHGSNWYGSSASHGQGLDNSGHSGTNSYNQGTSHTYYDNSGHRSGTKNIYNGGPAPSYTSTSDNRYGNTNYAKGDYGTHHGNVGYHQNSQYGGNEENPYSSGSSSTNDNENYRPGGTSRNYPSSYGTNSGQSVHNQEYPSSYPSRPNEYGQTSDIYIQGPGQYHRPYSTSSSQNPNSYQLKGHYITRPNQYGTGENSWSGTTIPYSAGSYGTAGNQQGTYDQNSYSRNENDYDTTGFGSQNRNHGGTVYVTKGSRGTYDQNYGGISGNENDGTRGFTSQDRNHAGTNYGSGSSLGTYDQSSWPSGAHRNENGDTKGFNSQGRDYAGTIYVGKGSRGTYDQNSWSGASNFNNNHNTGGSYGLNSPETYGTSGTGGSSGQHSLSGSNSRNTSGTYGHTSQDTHGTTYDSKPVGTTWSDDQSRSYYGTKGYGDSFSHNSWPGTQTMGNNQGVYGTKSTHRDNSWSGTQDRNVYGTKGVGSHTYGTQGSTFDGNTNHLNNQRVPVQNQYPDDDGITPNYDQVVHITHKVPYRNSYEPFFGTTQQSPNDYDDYRPNHSQKFIRSTTPKILEKSWPPPFPSTDVNADYVFEYEDPDVNVEAENFDSGKTKDGDCAKVDFLCQNKKCIPKTLVCNGARDCPDGRDEDDCLQYVSKFEVQKNKKLAILEKERWDNVSIAACALMCVENQKFRCRSFNYRKIDRTCFLTNTNEALTGAIISYHPFDFYELISEKINCSKKFLCPNRKCIEKTQICDGHDDCGDRTDEKNCTSDDFGYSVRLTGSRNKNEGFIEVTAFGKTGFVCDDKFGLNDASVVCKELGYNLGASEVKGNSFFGKGAKNETPFYMMDDVTCSGTEKRLLDCDFSGWGVHNCLGQEIAGVVCKTTTEKCASDYWQCDTGQECLPLAFVCDGLLDCTDGSDEGVQHCDTPTEIRLSNGTSQNQGRVEIRHHGTWGTICDDDLNDDAAKVICRQLGYKGSAAVKKDSFFGSGHGPIWLDQVFCSGNETSVEECSHWNWGEHNCDHSEDVGVICSNTNDYEERHSHKVAEIWKPVRYPERCGYRSDSIFNRDDDVHFRVVKGSVAKKGDYPWQAAIRVKGKTSTAHWCGAVILSEKFVLTAAHCLIGYAKGAYVIVAGDYNVDEEEGTEQEAHIEDYYLHEDFRRGHKMNNDIALVKLKGRGFSFNDHIQAICLPDADTSYETQQNCTISGFGSIESGKSAFSHNLRAGWIPLQKREICKMPHVYGDALTEGMICAGSLDEGIDSCDGDSGGPLACLYRGVFTLYGITSWGQHCGYANKPGVYVKVAHYRQWIDDTFKKYS